MRGNPGAGGEGGIRTHVTLPVNRISSAARSTSLPPLREAPGRGWPGRSKVRAVSRPIRLCQVPIDAKSGIIASVCLFRICTNPIGAAMDRASFFSPQAGRRIDAPRSTRARFAIGDVVRHRLFDFRGVVFDIDPVFANSEEWYQSIPEDVRPHREQPFYHLLAENAEFELCRLCQPAEPARRFRRRPGRSPFGRAAVRPVRRCPLQAAPRPDPLSGPAPAGIGLPARRDRARRTIWPGAPSHVRVQRRRAYRRTVRSA